MLGQSLSEADSLDEPENEDSGVKFACWGRSNDRFYTGSSDGYVKSWNIKAASGKAFVRDVLKVAGGIYTGAFSKDYSKLIVGDDTGTVYLLSIDDSDLEENKSAVILDRPRGVVDLVTSTSSNDLLPANLIRPKLIIPHPPPPPPHGSEIIQKIEDAVEISNRFLNEGQLRIFPNHDFPMARRAVFQGPNYHETLLYRFEAHEDNNASRPLLPTYLVKQQFIQNAKDQSQEIGDQPINFEELQYPGNQLCLFASRQSDRRAHANNMSLELDFEKMSLSTKASLEQDRVEVEGDFVFNYELLPSREHLHLGHSRNQSGGVCNITFKDLEERSSKPVHVFTSSYERERRFY